MSVFKRVLKIIKIGAVALSIAVLMNTMTAFAENDYSTYTYSNTGDISFSPDIYSSDVILTGTDIGVGSMITPSDLAFDSEGNLFVADTGNSRIVIYDTKNSTSYSLSEFKKPNGEVLTLKEPQGVCSGNNGYIYICDTGNNRLICCDKSGNVIMEIGKPDSQYFTDGIEFIPKKIAVDSAGNMYVSATGVYQGLSLFLPDGEFAGFYGAEEVEATSEVLSDYIWKQFMTEEQKNAMASYVPPEACNIYVSKRDFVLTISNSYYIPYSEEKSEMDSIRLLNPKGVNTLQLDTSKFPGTSIAQDAKYLNFTAGCIDKNGFITLLDNTKNKIFQYDNAMNLIGIFGGRGDEKGNYTTPVDIDTFDDKLYVLDSDNGTVTVYDETDYGALIHDALIIYNTAEQTQAIGPWKEVLKYNSNYDLAYVGIGRALLNSGNAKEAMEYFELGHDSSLYNEAFSVYRTEVVRSIGGWVLLAVVILLGAVAIIKKKIKVTATGVEKPDSDFKFMMNAVRHPFDGFERLKSKKRLSLKLSTLCIVLFAFLNLFAIQFTGKQFEMVNINEINLVFEICGSLLVLAIWALSNWCFSVLIEGKATFKEIWITTSYCLIPYTVASYIKIILTNFVIRQEEFLASCIVVVGILWSFVMLIAAFSNFHEFEGMQIFKAMFLTLIGMAIIVILIFVVYMLMQQLISAFLQVLNEVLFGIRNGWR